MTYFVEALAHERKINEALGVMARNQVGDYINRDAKMLLHGH